MDQIKNLFFLSRLCKNYIKSYDKSDIPKLPKIIPSTQHKKNHSTYSDPIPPTQVLLRKYISKHQVSCLIIALLWESIFSAFNFSYLDLKFDYYYFHNYYHYHHHHYHHHHHHLLLLHLPPHNYHQNNQNYSLLILNFLMCFIYFVNFFELFKFEINYISMYDLYHSIDYLWEWEKPQH